MIIIDTQKEQDIPQIFEIFYKAALIAYPNKELGITREDIEAWCADRFDPKKIEESIQIFRTPKPNRLLLVAKDGEKVVGACRFMIEENHNQIRTFYVLPEYQGKGIGTMLWEKGYPFFDSNKDTIVHVATYNEQAIGFYKKLGFVDTSKRFTEERHRMPLSKVLIPEMEMILILHESVQAIEPLR